MAVQDKKWAIKIYHLLAKPLIYQQIWSDAKFVLLEDEDSKLNNVLDISGLDVIIKISDNIDFMGQRFRRYDKSLAKSYDDFTLRDERPYSGYKAEAHKLLSAYRQGQNIAKYYAYGHVNDDETGFAKFRILYTREFLKKWDNNELTEPVRMLNLDDSSYFLAWKFKNLPPECIFWELNVPTKLEQKQVRLGCARTAKDERWEVSC